MAIDLSTVGVRVRLWILRRVARLCGFTVTDTCGEQDGVMPCVVMLGETQLHLNVFQQVLGQQYHEARIRERVERIAVAQFASEPRAPRTYPEGSVFFSRPDWRRRPE